jgi:hypothetical protein
MRVCDICSLRWLPGRASVKSRSLSSSLQNHLSVRPLGVRNNVKNMSAGNEPTGDVGFSAHVGEWDGSGPEMPTL